MHKIKEENSNNEVLDLLKKAQGYLKGHFCLTSGNHSDTYFQCAKLYQYPDICEKLAKKLSEKLKDIEFDTVIAPAIGAIIFGYEVAKQTGKRNLFVERKDGKMQLRRGYNIKRNEKVIIVEDVVTTAKTIKETIEAIKDYEADVVGYACIVDRTSGKTDYNFRSLLKMDPVIYTPDECPLCKEGILIEKPGSRINA